jgi:hypothetical protein
MRKGSMSGLCRSRFAATLCGALLVVAVLVVFAALGSGLAVAQAQAVPVNTAEPVVSGSATVGSTLIATDGTWSNSPTSFARQWVRCPSSGGAADGSDCAAITGAATSSYVVASGDVGFTLRIRVTGSNSDGAQTVASNHTAVVAAASAPVNTGQPVVSGSTVQGQTLTGTNGSWTGTTPISFAYQWVQCGSDGGLPDGSNCVYIANATSTTYTLQSSDVGFRIRLRVTATNTKGALTVASNATASVQAATAAGLPANTGQPVISGAAAKGQTLTATSGTWTSATPATYAFQWVRCAADGGASDGSNCASIAGATSTTYTLQAADVGYRIRVRVTATNSSGSQVAASNPTATVQAASTPPVSSGCAKTGGTVPITSISPPARLLVDGAQVSPSRVTYGTRSITARFHVSACGGSVEGALVYVTAVPYGQFANVNEQVTGSDGWATLQFTALAGFPVSSRQQVLVMFVRARKTGEDLLSGISSRRLVSFPVTHG